MNTHAPGLDVRSRYGTYRCFWSNLVAVDAQVTGVLELLNDLRGAASPLPLPTTWPRNASIMHEPGSGTGGLGYTQGSDRGEIRESGGDSLREFIILAGDFNFNSSSDGYGRLVRQGGLLESCHASRTPGNSVQTALVDSGGHVNHKIGRDEVSKGVTLPGEAGSEQNSSDPLDFVFFEPRQGISCIDYEVHREFSQRRYADGYPSVTVFELECV